MRLAYIYGGVSLGVAIYFLYLVVTGVRVELPIGAHKVDIFLVAVAVFTLLTLYVIYRLTERRS
ncbi:MAG: hypothetical protein ACK4SY_01465 [Pyrobaculum sp.]